MGKKDNKLWTQWATVNVRNVPKSFENAIKLQYKYARVLESLVFIIFYLDVAKLSLMVDKMFLFNL